MTRKNENDIPQFNPNPDSGSCDRLRRSTLFRSAALVEKDALPTDAERMRGTAYELLGGTGAFQLYLLSIHFWVLRI